jgi:hypothetical protein
MPLMLPCSMDTNETRESAPDASATPVIPIGHGHTPEKTRTTREHALMKRVAKSEDPACADKVCKWEIGDTAGESGRTKIRPTILAPGGGRFQSPGPPGRPVGVTRTLIGRMLHLSPSIRGNTARAIPGSYRPLSRTLFFPVDFVLSKAFAASGRKRGGKIEQTMRSRTVKATDRASHPKARHVESNCMDSWD